MNHILPDGAECGFLMDYKGCQGSSGASSLAAQVFLHIFPIFADHDR
jgi:hypothetical protein